MRHRIIGLLLVFSALAVAPLFVNQVRAQSQSMEKPLMYTYVSEWAVPRAMWADYQKVEDADNDSMRKMVADGTLISFGNYAVLNHQEGTATHGSWFSASSMVNIIKVLEGLRSAPNTVSQPLAASKHWDYIMSSRDYAAHAGTFTNGYLRVGNWKSRAGSSDPDGKIMKATMVALLDKLLSSGALHAYQIDEETVHSADPGTFFVVIVANGADGLDKFYTALDESEKSNPAGWAGYQSTIDSSGHRDMLAHVATMTHK
jgi:hypothetical protein